MRHLPPLSFVLTVLLIGCVINSAGTFYLVKIAAPMALFYVFWLTLGALMMLRMVAPDVGIRLPPGRRRPRR